MDQLIKRTHQQLKKIQDRLFDSFFARDVDFYSPEIVYDDYVFLDESDFEEPDVVGNVKAERLPLSYAYRNTIKVIEVFAGNDGRFSIIHNGELNQSEINRTYYFMAQIADLPLQSVLQYEVLVNPDDTSTQTIRLIKTDEQFQGKQPFSKRIHCFVPFHGEIA